MAKQSKHSLRDLSRLMGSGMYIRETVLLTLAGLALHGIITAAQYHAIKADLDSYMFTDASELLDILESRL